MTKPKSKAQQVEKLPEAMTIDPEVFRRILAGAKLEAIALIGVQCMMVDRNGYMDGIQVDGLQLNASAKYEMMKSDVGPLAVVYQTVIAKVVHGEIEAMTFECTYQLEYSVQEPFTDEFFEMFRQTTLLLQVVPFIRELAANLTGRMYVPPLTLPLVQI